MSGKFVSKAVDEKRGWAGCLDSCAGGKLRWGGTSGMVTDGYSMVQSPS